VSLSNFTEPRRSSTIHAMTRETFTRWDPAEHLRSEAEIDAYLEDCAALGDAELMKQARIDAERARARLRDQGAQSPRR
jgi:hypothetical protein